MKASRLQGQEVYEVASLWFLVVAIVVFASFDQQPGVATSQTIAEPLRRRVAILATTPIAPTAPPEKKRSYQTWFR